MLHGIQKVDGKYYDFNIWNGDEQTGFQTVNGKTYYFSPTMVTGQQQINNHWYDFDANGVMQTGFTKLSDGRLVYYNVQGQMQYGEQKINGKYVNC